VPALAGRTLGRRFRPTIYGLGLSNTPARVFCGKKEGAFCGPLHGFAVVVVLNCV
jgi:hypothetical protein